MSEIKRIEVNSILTYSWGYDQTNVDCFQVVRRSKSSVWIRPIGQSSAGEAGPMSERVMPEAGQFIGSTILRKAIKEYGGREYCVMDHGSARVWDGRSLYSSWYA